MTPTSAPLRSTGALIAFWVSVAYFVASIVAVVVVTARFALGVGESAEFVLVAVLFLGWVVMFYVLTLSAFRVAADRRAARAAAEHPGAFLLHIVARPSTRTQLLAVAQAFGLRVGGLPWNNYATVVADQAAIRLFAGSLSPSERIAIPTSSIVRVQLIPRTLGIRTITCIVLDLQDPAGFLRQLELVPVRWSGILMRVVPPQQLPAHLAQMQHATHPGL